MPDESRSNDPKYPKWLDRLVIAALVAWLALSCEANTSYGPSGYYQPDCAIIGRGVEIGSDC